MKTKVLVVGASPLQVPLIERLNSLGFITFSISNRPHDPGLIMSANGFNISILDFKKIEKLIKEEGIDFAITCGSDIGTYVVACINDKFNRKGKQTEQFLNVSHKGFFNRVLERLNLNHVPYISITKDSDLYPILDGIEQMPVILKPFFSSGTRGVKKVNTKEDIIKNHDDTIKASSIFKGYVIQDYIEGIEVGAECLVEDFRVVFLEFTTKINNEMMVPIGHFVPRMTEEKTRKEVKEQIEAIVSHIGLRNTPANMDIIIDSDGAPFIIDLSFRLGGNMLPDLMQCKYGLDPYNRIIDYMHHGNEKLDELGFETRSGNFASIIFNAKNRGVLTENKINKIHKVFTHNQISEIVFDLPKNHQYEKYTEGSKRFGHALGKFDSLKQYKNTLLQLHKIIDEE